VPTSTSQNPRQNQVFFTIADLWQLPAGVFRVLIGLAQFINHHGRCDPSQRAIGEKAGCSEGTVNNAIAALVERGIVLQTHRGRRETCIYQVTTAYLAAVKEARRLLTPEWWRAWRKPQRSRPVQCSIFAAKGYARKTKPSSDSLHPSAPHPRAQAGQKDQKPDEKVSQREVGPVAPVPAAPTPAAITANKRRNQITTLRRWAQHSPHLADDERLHRLDMLARAELAVDDWEGGRSAEDKRCYNILAKAAARWPLDVQVVGWVRAGERNGSHPAGVDRPSPSTLAAAVAQVAAAWGNPR
jgi:DNA-binding MarR family transcriptional regulator